MEILICFYIVFSYLVMIGFVSFLCHSEEMNVKNKSDVALVATFLLFAPLLLPFMAGAILCKILKE